MLHLGVECRGSTLTGGKNVGKQTLLDLLNRGGLRKLAGNPGDVLSDDTMDAIDAEMKREISDEEEPDDDEPSRDSSQDDQS